MILHNRNGITVDFSEGKLEITTAVIHMILQQQEGLLCAGEKQWQFQQPEPILSVRVTEADNNGRSAPYVCLTLETASAAETGYSIRIFRLSVPTVTRMAVYSVCPAGISRSHPWSWWTKPTIMILW